MISLDNRVRLVKQPDGTMLGAFENILLGYRPPIPGTINGRSLIVIASHILPDTLTLTSISWYAREDGEIWTNAAFVMWSSGYDHSRVIPSKIGSIDYVTGAVILNAPPVFETVLTDPETGNLRPNNITNPSFTAPSLL